MPTNALKVHDFQDITPGDLVAVSSEQHRTLHKQAAASGRDGQKKDYAF